MQRRSSKEEAPFPWRQCIVLALCNAAHFYTICSLFSYAGFLVVDLGWSPNVDEAGYVAGYLGSALVVGGSSPRCSGGAWRMLSEENRPFYCRWRGYWWETWLLGLQKRSTPL